MLPIIPLVWAAHAAGHEVLLATTSDMVGAGENAGLPVVDVFPDQNVWADIMHRMQHEMNGAHDDGSGLLPPEYEQALATGNPFGVFALTMTSGSIDAGRAFAPDLVVYTSDHVAGALTASKLGVPALETGNRVSWSMRDPGFRSSASFVDESLLESLRTSLNIPDDGPQLIARTDPRPPSMGGLSADAADVDDGVEWWPMSFVPFNGGSTVPEWARHRPARPRICVTLGTVVPRLTGTDVLSRVVAALADIDAEVVLATGDTDVSALEPLPDNVRPAGFVPLSALLPTCSLIIHHGGSGTTAAPMFYGVAQLVLPSFADNPMSAERVEARGIGVKHDPDTVDTITLRASIAQLLQDHDFTAAAGDVAAEMAAQPSPATVIDRAAHVVNGRRAVDGNTARDPDGAPAQAWNL